MELPHYTDAYYEAARQKRRYHTDPQYRLDRVNRARARAGLPPRQSIEEVNPWGVNDNISERRAG